MASLPHDREVAYAACVEAAVKLGADTARRLVQRAGESMLARAAAAAREDERQWLLEAAQLLTLHGETFRRAYQEALRREFTEPDAVAPREGAVAFESLELMGEAQVDEAVDLLRAQQAVAGDVDAELGELNALVSAAQGHQVVVAAENPFRPQVWVRALRHAAAQCGTLAWVRARWLQHISEGLGTELSAVYRQLCDQLRQRGVAPADFVVQAAPVIGARAAMPAAVANGTASLSPSAVPVLNLRDLRRLLAGEGAAGGVGSLATARAANDAPSAETGSTQGPGSETVSGAMTVPFAFEALQEMKQLDEAMRRMRERRSAPADEDRTLPLLRRDAASAMTPAQMLSQEVVRLMIENMAGDARLLPEVQRAVRELEPALLRLARHDPRFFRDKQHAARRFLTEITERSLAWTTADAPGFGQFLEPLRQAVQALAAMGADDAEPFEFALRTLQEAWAEPEQRSRRARANAARALMQAEKRNLVAQRIADGLKRRADVAGASAEVRRFLTGPWSQVMAAAEMAETTVTADPGGYCAIIGDLVWSTRPQPTVDQRTRLARLVPPMLATLRRGLSSIGYPADATRLFLDYLADIHQAALRPQSGPQPTSLQEGAPPRAAATSDDDEPEVWLEPAEAVESGLMACFPESASPSPVAGPRVPDTDRPPTPAGASSVRAAERLHEGIWVDLYIDEAWSRWRVAWASPHSLLFMFSDGAGKYKSMTRSVLDTMMGLGALRIVSEQTLLDGALDAVAERALRNSMESVR